MKTIAIIGLAAALLCCQSKKMNEDLDKEVMGIHDDVMPRMGEIARLKRELQEQLNSPALPSESRRVILIATIQKLDSANQAMMNWMHRYSPLPDSTDEEQARAYLLSEKERIILVKNTMLEAIERAKTVQYDTL